MQHNLSSKNLIRVSSKIDQQYHENKVLLSLHHHNICKELVFHILHTHDIVRVTGRRIDYRDLTSFGVLRPQ